MVARLQKGCFSPLCTQFPPLIRQDFVHHLIFNQIQSGQSCSAAWGINGGSCVFCVSCANEKFQSTHGCHFFHPAFHFKWVAEKVWLTHHVYFQHRPTQPRPDNVSAPLHMVVSSKSNHIIFSSKFELASGAVLYAYQVNMKQKLFSDHEMPSASLGMIWGLIKTSFRQLIMIHSLQKNNGTATRYSYSLAFALGYAKHMSEKWPDLHIYF